MHISALSCNFGVHINIKSRKYEGILSKGNFPFKDGVNRKAITMQSKETQSGGDNSQTRRTHQR
jgi:hypothetical protein